MVAATDFELATANESMNGQGTVPGARIIQYCIRIITSITKILTH